jgi:hypothetical protein
VREVCYIVGGSGAGEPKMAGGRGGGRGDLWDEKMSSLLTPPSNITQRREAQRMPVAHRGGTKAQAEMDGNLHPSFLVKV